MRGPIAVLVTLVCWISVQAAQPEHLKVSIAQTSTESELLVGENNPARIHVLVSNIGDKPLKVWQSWNMWGALNIEIEFYRRSGELIGVVGNSRRTWTMNAPTFDIVGVGSHQVFPIDIGLAGNWRIEGHLADLEKEVWHEVLVRARYTILPDSEAKEFGVWTGKSHSSLQKFRFRIRRERKENGASALN